MGARAAAATPVHPSHPPHPPETTRRSMQNLLLGIGVPVMMGVVALATFMSTTLPGPAQVAIIVALTAVTLAVPLWSARVGLITTSEWTTPIGLLLVLLDGRQLWTGGLSHSGLRPTTYAGLICLIAAGVALGYQWLNGLAVPRFAAILLIQPIPVLLLHPWLRDLPDWAATLTALAAVDLIIARRSRRSRTHGRYLRAAVRTLQEVVTAGAVVTGAISLSGTHNILTTLRAGAPLYTASVVFLAAGLLFGRPPMPDIAAGVATLTGIVGIGKMGGYLVPGWGVVATATGVLVSAFAMRMLPTSARRGAQYAGATAMVLTTYLIVARGWSALVAPIRAAMPAWTADLAGYPAKVAHGAGAGTGQLVLAVALIAIAAGVMLPDPWRRDGVVAGVAVATVLMPGVWHLGWGLAITVACLVALMLGGFTLTASSGRSAWIGIGAALVVGGYAAGLATARPEAQALLLFTLALGGATIGVAGLGTRPTTDAPPRYRILGQVWDGVPNARAADAGWGAAAFAFPGAIAGATASLSPTGTPNALAILAASFVAVAGTLCATAISQVARPAGGPLLVSGATLGAAVVALAAVRTPHIAGADIAVAMVLLGSAGLLTVAPMLSAAQAGLAEFAPRAPRDRPIGLLRRFGLDGEDAAAAAVTAASIAALTRVTSLVLPGQVLGVMAVLVFLVAAGTRTMPDVWRRGPVIGGGLVGVGVAAAAGVTAVRAAIAVVSLNRPLWHVSPIGWSDRLAAASGTPAHASAAVLALVFIATAAKLVLGDRNARIAGVVALGLAALAAPVAFGTGWWGPALFSGAMATAAGVLAAVTRDRVGSMVCAGIATVLFADTIAGSLVAAATTGATLIGSAFVCAVVAAVAARTIGSVAGNDGSGHGRAEDGGTDVGHLVLIGGGALAGAIITIEVGVGTLAAAAHGSRYTVLTCALIGLAAALGALAAAAYRVEPLLSHATGAITVGGMAVALAAADNLTVAGAFAAVGAMFAVIAEVIRAAADRTSPAVRSVTSGFLPRRTTVFLAAGPGTILAVASVAPTLVAALVGPYRWVSMIWTGAPATSVGALGPTGAIVGRPLGVLTAVLLTVMATIAAIGFGGSRAAIVGRLVAVVVPSVAITLLIAPFLLHADWPVGTVAALTVATLCGLAVALTNEPPDTETGNALRAARRLVTAIGGISAGSALAGSLATPVLTLASLAVTALSGLIAALYGRTVIARVTGWVVTTAGWQLLVMVSCLRLGLAPYYTAFVVGAVAAVMLVLSATLPRLRKPAAASETLTVEVGAYGSALLALVLAAQSRPHLAVFLAAWGAVLGLVAARQRRSHLYRSLLMWTAAGHELVSWCLLMAFANVAVPEAYTLGIAVVALVTGWIEQRWHEELTSWVTYGVALAAALGPSLAIVIGTGETSLRRGLLLAAAAATTIAGAIRRQQAPVIIGGVVLLGAVGNEIARNFTTVSILLLMAVIAAVLIGVGANYEKRRRKVAKWWGAVNRMK